MLIQTAVGFSTYFYVWIHKQINFASVGAREYIRLKFVNFQWLTIKLKKKNVNTENMLRPTQSKLVDFIIWEAAASTSIFVGRLSLFFLRKFHGVCAGTPNVAPKQIYSRTRIVPYRTNRIPRDRFNLHKNTILERRNFSFRDVSPLCAQCYRDET